MLKDWKEQTTKTQKSMGGRQFINLKRDTQISVSKWDFDKVPNNYQFNVFSKKEALKGYPHQRLGITGRKAYLLLVKWMREHK